MSEGDWSEERVQVSAINGYSNSCPEPLGWANVKTQLFEVTHHEFLWNINLNVSANLGMQGESLTR